MRELKPCPFCGSEARIVRDKPYRGNEPTYHPAVACTECKAAMGYFRDEAEAVAAWNRRAQPDNEPSECHAMVLVEGGIPYCSDKQAACDGCKPDNEPLTLDELRGMDGEPVWCEDTTNYSGIIKLAEDWSTEKLEAHIWTFGEEGNPECHNVRLMMEFGARFYRRKPEPEGGEG